MMHKLISMPYLACIFVAMPVLGADSTTSQMTDTEKKIAQSISIQESGKIDESVKGRNIGLIFFDGRKRGDVSTSFLKGYLTSKGISSNGGWMPKPFRVLAYTHIYSEDKNFDSGSVMIGDIQPSGLVMSKIHMSESIIRSYQANDPLKLDAGIVNEGAKLSQSMGSSAGIWGGVVVNLAFNLARAAFSESTPSGVPNEKNLNTGTASNCGESCKTTHHVVVFTVLYDADPKHYYSLALDRVDDKINESNLTVLANQGLQAVAEKIAQAVVSN